MEIKKFELCYKQNIYDLYIETILKEPMYKHLSFEEFDLVFFKNKSFDNNGCFLSFSNNKLIGIIIGFINAISQDTGYIGLLLVDINNRNTGVGSLLLNSAEKYLKEKGAKKIKFGYTGQLNIPWYIPRTTNHDHAGAPGVVINSNLYFFLYKSGYNVVDICDAFHLDLDKFVLQEEIKDIIKNNPDNLKIVFYDKSIHYGLDEFYLAINDYFFEQAIKANLALSNPKPFLVIVQDNRILGWTGALYPEASGRAHFDGIIISPEIRGKKMGKALFSMLAIKSKELGATYMSFFTNIDNHARYIYLSLGFKIINSFAIMEKKLN